MTMRSIGAAALLLSAVFTSHAEATTIDLTTAGASGTLNGAIYTQGSVVSGTGVFPSFVQIQPQTGNTTTEKAYNTTVNNVLNNGPADPHNHEVRLSAVPIINVSGTNYYSFLLDINESSGQGHAGEQFLSLDRIQLYTSTAANLSTTTFDASGLLPGLGTLRYDSGLGNEALLDYSLGSGSGKSDLELLVPVSDFAGALGSNYLYLYSAFGALGTVNGRNYGASAGFEEWALGRGSLSSCPGGNPPPCSSQLVEVPEPTSLAALGSAFVMFGILARRRRRV